MKAVKNILIGIIVVLLFSFARQACADDLDGPSEYSIQKSYTNPVYGFRVAIPDHLTAYGDAPPRPNHGIQIPLGPDRSVSVIANFDPLFLGSGKADIRQRMGYDQGKSLKLWKGKLGPYHADQGSYLTEKSIYRLADMYAIRDGSPILYDVELETDAEHEMDDTKVFDKVVASFRKAKRQ